MEAQADFVRKTGVIGHIWPGSESAMRRAIRRGDFPAPVQIAPRIVAWSREALDAWKAARIAAGKAVSK